ncbi:MAG TPA: DUF2231 domain-containing protein [Polyangiaceae bacterium]|nr:DUF2231 domain-containing protein [Polyangiaceae bacterium]
MNIWEIHPALVHFPLTLLLASTVLEIVARRTGRESTARTALLSLGAGLIAAVVVAMAGAVAYFTVPPHSDEADGRILLHGLLALSAAALYAIAFLLRFKHRAMPSGNSGLVLSVSGALLLFAAGSLGGYLVYHDGVGVVPNEKSPLDKD